jgi:DNA modification methylase
MYNLLCSYSYSNKINLPSFADARKFKMENATLNKYQKPVLLFMKHLAMWAPQGSIIIDVTAGTGTTGVCSLMCQYLVNSKLFLSSYFYFYHR